MPTSANHQSAPRVMQVPTGAEPFRAAPVGTNPGTSHSHFISEVSKVTAALGSAITAACRLRGDGDEQRDALLAESAHLPVEHQLEMTAHFAIEAAIWSQATGQSSHTAARAAKPRRRRRAAQP